MSIDEEDPLALELRPYLPKFKNALEDFAVDQKGSLAVNLNETLAFLKTVNAMTGQDKIQFKRSVKETVTALAKGKDTQEAHYGSAFNDVLTLLTERLSGDNRLEALEVLHMLSTDNDLYKDRISQMLSSLAQTDTTLLADYAVFAPIDSKRTARPKRAPKGNSDAARMALRRGAENGALLRAGARDEGPSVVSKGSEGPRVEPARLASVQIPRRRYQEVLETADSFTIGDKVQVRLKTVNLERGTAKFTFKHLEKSKKNFVTRTLQIRGSVFILNKEHKVELRKIVNDHAIRLQVIAPANVKIEFSKSVNAARMAFRRNRDKDLKNKADQIKELLGQARNSINLAGGEDVAQKKYLLETALADLAQARDLAVSLHEQGLINDIDNLARQAQRLLESFGRVTEIVLPKHRSLHYFNKGDLVAIFPTHSDPTDWVRLRREGFYDETTSVAMARVISVDTVRKMVHYQFVAREDLSRTLDMSGSKGNHSHYIELWDVKTASAARMAQPISLPAIGTFGLIGISLLIGGVPFLAAAASGALAAFVAVILGDRLIFNSTVNMLREFVRRYQAVQVLNSKATYAELQTHLAARVRTAVDVLLAAEPPVLEKLIAGKVPAPSMGWANFQAYLSDNREPIERAVRRTMLAVKEARGEAYISTLHGIHLKPAENIHTFGRELENRLGIRLFAQKADGAEPIPLVAQDGFWVSPLYGDRVYGGERISVIARGAAPEPVLRQALELMIRFLEDREALERKYGSQNAREAFGPYFKELALIETLAAARMANFDTERTHEILTVEVRNYGKPTGPYGIRVVKGDYYGPNLYVADEAKDLSGSPRSVESLAKDLKARIDAKFAGGIPRPADIAALVQEMNFSLIQRHNLLLNGKLVVELGGDKAEIQFTNLDGEKAAFISKRAGAAKTQRFTRKAGEEISRKDGPVRILVEEVFPDNVQLSIEAPPTAQITWVDPPVHKKTSEDSKNILKIFRAPDEAFGPDGARLAMRTSLLNEIESLERQHDSSAGARLSKDSSKLKVESLKEKQSAARLAGAFPTIYPPPSTIRFQHAIEEYPSHSRLVIGAPSYQISENVRHLVGNRADVFRIGGRRASQLATLDRLSDKRGAKAVLIDSFDLEAQNKLLAQLNQAELSHLEIAFGLIIGEITPAQFARLKPEIKSAVRDEILRILPKIRPVSFINSPSVVAQQYSDGDILNAALEIGDNLFIPLTRLSLKGPLETKSAYKSAYVAVYSTNVINDPRFFERIENRDRRLIDPASGQPIMKIEDYLLLKPDETVDDDIARRFRGVVRSLDEIKGFERERVLLIDREEATKNEFQFLQVKGEYSNFATQEAIVRILAQGQEAAVFLPGLTYQKGHWILELTRVDLERQFRLLALARESEQAA